MDGYGNTTEGSSLDNGGEISGDLNVVGNIDVVNLNVSDTLTANTVITNEELEIKDTLITCGVDNPSNSFNLGLLNEYTDGVKSWAGLLRSKDDNNFYLLRDQTTKPSPTVDIRPSTVTELATLNVNQLESNVLKADNLIFTKNGIAMGDINTWIINPEQGTANQVLTYNSGTDEAEWKDSQGGGGTQTLQQTYDLSSEPQISNTALSPTLVLRQTALGVSDELLELQNIAGNKRMVLSSDGKLNISGSNSSINLQTSAGVDKWFIQNTGAADTLKISSTGLGDSISITQGGNISFHTGSNEYRFPGDRGSAGQVLTAQLDGSFASWETPSTGSSTLQEAFDGSSDPQIETDATNPVLTVKSHLTSGNAFSVLDSNDSVALNVDASGTCEMKILEADSITVKDIGIKNDAGTDRYLLGHGQSSDNLNLLNGSSNELLTISQDGRCDWNVSNNNVMRLTDSGNLNIGDNVATLDNMEDFYEFNVQGVSSGSSYTEVSDHVRGSTFLFRKARGVSTALTPALAGDATMAMFGQGYNGQAYVSNSQIATVCTEDQSFGNQGARFCILTCKNGTNNRVERFCINGTDGAVVFGDLPSGSGYYVFPVARGVTGDVLRMDSAGDALEWAAITPAVTVDNSISRFDGVTGLLQGSGWTIDNSGNMTDGTNSFTGATGLATPECHADAVYLKDGIGVDQWSISDEGANTLNIRNTLGVDTIVIGQTGTTQFHVSGTTEAVIDSTGLHMQGNDIQAVANLTCTDIRYSVPHFDGYFYGNNAQTLVTLGTYEQADFGTAFVTGTNLTDFTVANTGVVTYAGSRDRKCEVTFSFSMGTDVSQSVLQLELFIAVNVPPDLTLDNSNGSNQMLFMSANDQEIHTGSVHFYPTLSNGDTLRLYIRSVTDNNALIELRTGNFIGTCLTTVIP